MSEHRCIVCGRTLQATEAAPRLTVNLPDSLDGAVKAICWACWLQGSKEFSEKKSEFRHLYWLCRNKVR